MWNVVRLTFLEIRRKRLLVVSLVITVLFLVLFFGLMNLLKGTYASAPTVSVRVGAEQEGGVVGDLLGCFFAYFLFAFFAIFSLIGVVSEEEEGQLLAVLPRPISRAEWLMGKWLGNALVQALYVGFVMAGISLIIHGLFPYFHFLFWGLIKAWLLFTLETWVLSSLTTLLSLLLPPIASGIIVSLLFFIAFIGGVIGQFLVLSIKHFVGFEYAGMIISLMMPSDGLYRRALHELSGQAQTMAPTHLGLFGVGNSTSDVWILYAVIYIVACLLLATWRFRKKSF